MKISRHFTALQCLDLYGPTVEEDSHEAKGSIYYIGADDNSPLPILSSSWHFCILLTAHALLPIEKPRPLHSISHHNPNSSDHQ